jgi:hypothetical protein
VSSSPFFCYISPIQKQLYNISFILRAGVICLLAIGYSNVLISQNTINQPTSGTTTLFAGTDFFSGDFYEDSGAGFVPGNFSNGESGTLSFCACPGEQFSIVFNEFLLQITNVANNDYLTITGSSNTKDGNYFGNNNPGTVMSSAGGCIDFTFISNIKHVAPGWSATFSPGIGQTFYADEDGDGFGDPNNSVTTCSIPPPGFVANSSDDCPQVFGLMFGSCDDGNMFTDGDILNESCVCAGPIVIPTLSQWGLIVLGLGLFIFSIIAIRKKQSAI